MIATETAQEKLDKAIENFSETDLLDSALQLAQAINDIAREVLLRDGHHNMMFFIVCPDKHVEILSGDLVEQMRVLIGRPEEEYRYVAKHMVKRMIEVESALAVAHISEGWTYATTDMKDPVVNAVEKEGLRIEDLDDSLKQEVLSVTVSTKEKDSITCISEIKRDGDEMSLGDVQMCSIAGSEGKELGFFQNYWD